MFPRTSNDTSPPPHSGDVVAGFFFPKWRPGILKIPQALATCSTPFVAFNSLMGVFFWGRGESPAGLSAQRSSKRSRAGKAGSWPHLIPIVQSQISTRHLSRRLEMATRKLHLFPRFFGPFLRKNLVGKPEHENWDYSLPSRISQPALHLHQTCRLSPVHQSSPPRTTEVQSISPYLNLQR